MTNFEEIKSSIIVDGDTCSSPQGHCFGSDGGSGIPENLKVALGRGGTHEIVETGADKTEIIGRYDYLRCQFCMKYKFSEEVSNVITE